MDDKSNTRPQDTQRVNVNEDSEVRYCDEEVKKFGCTTNQLKVAVKKVGFMVKSVEKELKGK